MLIISTNCENGARPFCFRLYQYNPNSCSRFFLFFYLALSVLSLATKCVLFSNFLSSKRNALFNALFKIWFP